jgi:two-component system heavy metal sensor histidine kinase CusS
MHPMNSPGRRGSLIWRAALAFALVCAGVLSLSGLFLYRSLAAELAYRDDLALMGRLEQVRALLQDSGDLVALQQRPRLYQNMLGNEESLLLVGRGEHADVIAINPHNDPVPPLQALAVGQAPRREQIQLWQPEDSAPLLLLAGNARGGNGELLRVTVGKRLGERTAVLGSYRWRIYFAVAAGALSALGLGWLLLRRALRPLRQIALSVSSIDRGSLDRRLALDHVPLELHEPVQALNGLLERLDDSFARLSQFSADLAHEMRTPLHTLLSSNGQALSQARSVSEYQEVLASNVEEFERLNRMVANLLFLARAEHGACPLNGQAIDLRTLGTELCEYFEALAEDRDLELHNGLQGYLTADPPLLKRALANLLANAIRHAAPGTRIELRSPQAQAPQTLCVLNHGSTIAPEHLPRLFERFYRADQTRTDPGNSGGLGLAIVQSIMSLHGGSAAVSSVAGVTVFSLAFPARPPAAST